MSTIHTQHAKQKYQVRVPLKYIQKIVSVRVLCACVCLPARLSTCLVTCLPVRLPATFQNKTKQQKQKQNNKNRKTKKQKNKNRKTKNNCRCSPVCCMCLPACPPAWSPAWSPACLSATFQNKTKQNNKNKNKKTKTEKPKTIVQTSIKSKVKKQKTKTIIKTKKQTNAGRKPIQSHASPPTIRKIQKDDIFSPGVWFTQEFLRVLRFF